MYTRKLHALAEVIGGEESFCRIPCFYQLRVLADPDKRRVRQIQGIQILWRQTNEAVPRNTRVVVLCH